MTSPRPFIGRKQDGNYWTQDERDKAVYVAKRAIQRGREPVEAVMAYMGMDRENAERCSRAALNRIVLQERRAVHG